MLITFYGINNIGKTTHTKRLEEQLRELGYDVVRVKYPVYDLEPTGTLLNRVLRSGEAQAMTEKELQLWFVMNRYQFEPTLKAWLEAKKIVIAEDYIGTGIAWGVTKGVPLEWLETVNDGLIREEVAFLLDGQRTAQAVEAGHLHETDNDLIERSRTVHRTLGERYGWTRLTVQPTPEETFELLWAALKPHLPRLG